MLKLFSKYASVGVVNTLIHWAIFTVLFISGQSQSTSNFLAFCCAVTFSFFVNAKWTFSAEATAIRYLLYLVFMGALAITIGWYADRTHITPITTLVVFSAISLVCGFIYSKYVIFRDKK